MNYRDRLLSLVRYPAVAPDAASGSVPVSQMLVNLIVRTKI